jgi:SulP family sulfate permease
MLLPTAFTIAMLGAIESLLSATVADGVTGDKHDSNTELIAQGVANVVAPLFGGIPATGAIARTMTNINNGGKTPIAGIIHAVVLLLIMLFLGNLTKHIPMACLAGVLVVVAYNMSEWRTFKNLLSNPKADVAVLITTFLLTVIFDLTIAIEIGLLLAVVLFIRRISESSNVSVFTEEVHTAEYVEAGDVSEKLTVPNGVEIYEIEGPFFFGVASKFEETMKQIGDKPKVRIIRMRKVPFIDSTGCHNLESFIKMSKKDKTQVLLSGVNERVRSVLLNTGIERMLGQENILSNINDAVERAKQLVEK